MGFSLFGRRHDAKDVKKVQLEKYVKPRLREMKREANQLNKTMKEILARYGVNEYEDEFIGALALYEVLRDDFGASHEMAFNNARYTMPKKYWDYWDAYFEVAYKHKDTPVSLFEHTAYKQVKQLISQFFSKYKPLGEYMASEFITRPEATQGYFLSALLSRQLLKKLEAKMLEEIIEHRKESGYSDMYAEANGEKPKENTNKDKNKSKKNKQNAEE